ncbi:hypothetical protein WHT83_10840 [Aminobacter sp. P9b]|uniref:Uncharacterized protein n=1 Tax=Aminobacter niigataensis TaxID=83265 RepID=A0ABR6L5U6_9HYPH|nr:MULTISPECIES: hypothetical protein [Aminobacter]AWC25103.1 hypothetical protein CO731_04597 [Aminobacter sp. MSH1]MBB4651996.1 hypothetical protein [Aminobacter niigataensis]CAI2935841.1 conserved exported protein of unknown function [Aminobacter niigataensis]
MKAIRLTSVGLAAALFLGASAAQADQLLGTYVARISERDHQASDGYALDSAAQVVRQDRANVHRHIQTDEEDDIDGWFTTNAKRARFEQLLNRPGAMSNSTRSAILHGDPLIEVEVYRESVRVRLLD